MTGEKKYCFSLIELVVTITTITILISILLPALVHAKNKATGTSCGNNLKQLSLALNSYANDFNGYFIPYKEQSAAPTMSGIQYWFGMSDGGGNYDLSQNSYFSDYIANCANVLVCPALRPKITNLKETSKTGYGYNGCWLGGYVKLNGFPFSPQISILKSSATTIAFGDSAYVNTMMGGPQYSPMLWPRERPDSAPGYKSIHFRHSKNGNIGWVDGHVSTERPVEADTSFEGGLIGDFRNDNNAYSIH